MKIIIFIILIVGMPFVADAPDIAEVGNLTLCTHALTLTVLQKYQFSLSAFVLSKSLTRITLL